jgi:hypothetical protein
MAFLLPFESLSKPETSSIVDDVTMLRFDVQQRNSFCVTSYLMTGEKNIFELPGTIITINTPIDAHYWSKRLSISPFTLFHLLRTVGNHLTEIVEFLHKTDPTALTRPTKPVKEFTIL